jgi:hypothetical protein
LHANDSEEVQDEARDEPGEDADEDDNEDVDKGQVFDEDEDEEEADAKDDGLSDHLASLPEEQRIPFLKHQVRKDAAARSLQEHNLEEHVDEDEDGYWHHDADGYWYWYWYSYCDDQDGGADVDDDDAPTNPDLSTPPDADADPTEVIDAGAEDEEGNEDTALVATSYHHKRRKVTFTSQCKRSHFCCSISGLPPLVTAVFQVPVSLQGACSRQRYPAPQDRKQSPTGTKGST